jgi:hypothetical protein
LIYLLLEPVQILPRRTSSYRSVKRNDLVVDLIKASFDRFNPSSVTIPTVRAEKGCAQLAVTSGKPSDVLPKIVNLCVPWTVSALIRHTF